MTGLTVEASAPSAPRGEGRLGTVSKVGRVLNLYTPERPEWGVSEVARELGLARSSAHELLASLESIHLLQRTPTARYRLGWRLLRMAGSVSDASTLKSVAPPVLERLAERTGQSVYLSVWEGDEVFYLSRVIGSRGVTPEVAGPGTGLPGHATASGKMLLGGMGDARVVSRALLRSSITLTPRTSTDPRRLSAEIDEAARVGVAFARDEAMSGVGSLAVPVRGEGGRLVAVVGVATVTKALNGFADEHLGLVQRACAAIAAAMRKATVGG